MRFIYTRTFAIFSACVIILFITVFLQAKGWLFPLQDALVQLPRPVIKAVQAAAKPVSGFFSTLYQLGKISRQNGELQQKTTRLEQDLVSLDQLKRENDVLKAELGFVNAAKRPYQPCTVIAHNPLGLIDSLLLNCGIDEGVAEGQAVISRGYLIGKVVYANKDSSTILLITNSKFAADARLSKTGAPGLVGGSFGTGLVLDRLSQNDPLEHGWLVVTAGISDKIPKDILVGEVGEVISGPNDLFKKVTIVSPVDYDNLDYVLVAK